MALTKEQSDIVALTAKMMALGVHAKHIRTEAGPIVTTYYFHPNISVPISKILNRSEDFALAVGAEAVQIQRIGNEIALFVANKDRVDVDFKSTLHYILTDQEASHATIPIPLGVDHTGKASYLDLINCPHLLLAGSTGSGKSMFESAILSILGIAKTPQELKVHIVDLKKLDLPQFSSLPIVESCSIELMEYLQMMKHVLEEHDFRLRKMMGAGARNIAEFNSLGMYELPRILIMIDEFADLNMQDKEARRDKDHPANTFPKADFLLQRIVQVGRATGIHVIAATQRTSVKIITGDIKANFPCRISLRLPTQDDSRTILGTGGAENLLGKGDMLVQYPESETLRRYHGPKVNSSDIAYVVCEHKQVKEMYDSIRGR